MRDGNTLKSRATWPLGPAIVGVLLCNMIAHGDEGRTSISLNGTRQIEESVSATEAPGTFSHSVVVPGLVDLAKPAFADVGLFAGRGFLDRYGRRYPADGPQILPPSAPLPTVGISLQKRDYFWY